MPPLGWLFQMEHPIERAAEVLSEAFPILRNLGTPPSSLVGSETAPNSSVI